MGLCHELLSVCALRQIWTVSKDWETAWDGWKTGLFTDLDVEEMESAAGAYTKKVSVYGKIKHNIPVALSKVFRIFVVQPFGF